MGKIRRWAVMLLFCAGAAGCTSSGSVGSSTGAGLVAVFPSKERLNEIAAQPLPKTPSDRLSTVSVDSWQPDATVPSSSAENELLRKSAKHPTLTMSAELTCAAREIARFVALKRGLPDQQLRNHLLGQCGDVHPEHSLQYWTIELRGTKPTDEALLAELTVPVKKLAASLPMHPLDVGTALVRENDTAVLMTVQARRYAELEPVATVSAEGTFEVSGKMLLSPAAVFAMVTSGEYSVARCSNDPSVRLPHFRTTCKLADGDDSAWIDIQLLEHDRVLARSAVRLLARRSADPKAFALPEERAPASSDASSYRRKLFSAINALRRKSGLPALTYAGSQSAEHEKLAPYFFASQSDGSNYSDDIALGLMAGWEVPGTIRGGSFYGTALHGTVSAERWLRHLLDYPAARAILFDPEASMVALGPVIDAEAATVGALISTYSFYEGVDHELDRKRVVELIASQRRALGAATARATRDPELEGAVLAIKQGMDPRAALNGAMETIVRRDGRSVQGVVLETLLLDGLELPEELTRQKQLDYSVEVTHVRHPGAAWGTLVVLIVITQPKTQTAGVAAPSRG